MSNRVKVVTYLSTTIKSRPTNAIWSIAHSRPVCKASRNIFVRPDPNQPGCSKWFSSATTHYTIPRRTFFNSNGSNAPYTDEGTDMNVDESKEIGNGTIYPLVQSQRPKSPHLPLPPSLPYSPNSFPFKRHLEILSLSIYSSTPDESWSIYQSLHPSLRQFIPDDVFKSLLLHQADHTQQPRAWNRIKILLKLAKKCRMSLEEIGSEIVTKIIRLGARRFRNTKDNEEKRDEIYKIIRRLYLTLEGILPTRQIPHEIRRGWLGIHLMNLQRLRKTSRRDGSNQIVAIEELTLNMVNKGGAVGLGHYIGEILILSSERSKEGLEQSFENLVWCLAREVDVKSEHLLKVMRRLCYSYSKNEEDGSEILRSKIPTTLKSLNIEPISNTAQTLYRALDLASRQARSRVEKALELIETGQMGIGGLIGRGISIAKSSEPDMIAILDTAIRLLELAIQHKESHCGALVSSLTIALQKAKDSNTNTDEIDLSIIRFSRLLQEAQIISQLPSESIIPLFRLIISALPSSEAYIMSRKVYQYARSASPPYLWSRKNLSSWQQLFRFSITSPNLHLHFASRLYTDLMADGVPIRRTDALMLIRAIGSKASPTRAVLLERHIKDYLWSKYGSISPLISALVRGLTQGGVRDTQLALDLAHRLSEGKQLDSNVVEIIIRQLSQSTNPQDRIKIFHLLAGTDKDENAIKNYNTVLSYLVTSSRRQADLENNKLSHIESLGFAIHLYKEMISKHIKPNSRTISNMIRSLIDSGYLESSISTFRACIQEKVLIKSNVVGRLMVNLAMNDRIIEAYQIELSWRNLMEEKYKNHQVWDKGVVGAKVLIDIKNGKDVDLNEIAKRTGWIGKEGFMNFLETLKPPSPPRNEKQEITVDEGLNKYVEHVSFDEEDNRKPLFWDNRNPRIMKSKKDNIDLCMGSGFNVVLH
ncbi:uncharacterized protein I206_104784 [Kwoniella pini CBS 10737]|uniref:Uncharacterized protein n=1 Tax=Kwoniella pini CBS 10737 TaxID=1296096 RepID=A0A1B9I7T4_9TREE|nr:uncharacterized protein I206_02323 [Kwoniella pini CBS 10737]OCF51608.1 hypothetical protein I206_02323 [Kwoniella pini CBS 10737]